MRNKYTTEELYRIQKTVSSSSYGDSDENDNESSELMESDDSGLREIAKYVDISNANIYTARILKHADEYYDELSGKEGAMIINKRALKGSEERSEEDGLESKMACCLHRMCEGCRKLIKSNNNVQVTVKPPGTFARMADMARKAEDLQISFKMLKSLRSALPVAKYEKELYDSLNCTSSSAEESNRNHNIDREKCLKLKDLFNNLAVKYRKK